VYYTSLTSAINNNIVADIIPNPLSFANTTPTSMPIGVRVINSITGCFAVAQITLVVPTTNFQPSSNFSFTVCDDFLDANGYNTSSNNNSDGIATFDFSATKAAILSQLPSSQNYTINYYKNQADALSQLNPITDTAHYRNIGYPNSQDIWVRIETDITNSCIGIGPYIRLHVEALPVANPVQIARTCDTNRNGIAQFNTTLLESTLLNGQNNVSVRYLDQNNNPLKDANGILISSPFPATFLSTTQTIKAIVTNNSPQHCYAETSISFYVDANPTVTSIPANLTTICDDEIDPANQDGKYAFDTSTFESTILAGQTGMNIKYYDQNNNPLPSPLPNPFVTTTQNVTVVVENPINTNCSTTLIIPFIIQPLPNIELNSSQLICSNIPSFFVTLDTGFLSNTSLANFDYNWKKEGTNLNITTPTLDVNLKGNYTVDVTNQSGCSRTRSIQVTASNSATITAVDILDLVDVNTVTINTSGPGDYEYSMDFLNGIWQDSNFFTNVPGGIHQVFVNDKNGCGVVTKEITILSIPKFFTPNNDSYNDYWTVKGMISYPNSELRIFDRYGKLLKELTPNSLGWDGTFNGQELPASDYWFVFKMDTSAPEKRGHFTLKR
jgi:gliding motility-associated-like protein